MICNFSNIKLLKKCKLILLIAVMVLMALLAYLLPSSNARVVSSAHSKQFSTLNAKDQETLLLASVIEAEAGDQSFVAKVAVGSVILNRVKSGKFPGTISGVIYQPGAFESVANGSYLAPASKASLDAAKEAEKGWDPTGGALYFWNPSKQVNAWVWSRTVVARYGDQVFAL